MWYFTGRLATSRSIKRLRLPACRRSARRGKAKKKPRTEGNGAGREIAPGENKDFRDRDLYVYCFTLPEGNITAYQSPLMIGSNVKELKLPPNNPVGQRAYDAVAKAAEGEIVSFAYDFPKPGTKAPVSKETLEAVSASRHAASVISRRRAGGVDRSQEIDGGRGGHMMVIFKKAQELPP